jgi:hypothetical protein
VRGGFREASHIGRQITISWDEASLLNLVIRRALHNSSLRTFYSVDIADTLADRNRQIAVFYRIFPKKVTAEPLRTFEWMLQNTCDGTSSNSPRELVHLLSTARQFQLRRFEVGQAPPEGDTLFDAGSLVRALPEVARVRFEQTLCAEYPQLRDHMLLLENEMSQHTPDTLATIWRVSMKESAEIAYRLVDVGFFKAAGTHRAPRFLLPPLYQRALKIKRSH